jgi:hypothetical protein
MLTHHGFLGATPEKPVLAFSFKLFKTYRQLHWVCPRLSIDAFARVLNHLHRVCDLPLVATYVSCQPHLHVLIGTAQVTLS